MEVKRYMEPKEVERIIAMPQWEEVMMLVKKSLFMIWNLMYGIAWIRE